MASTFLIIVIALIVSSLIGKIVMAMVKPEQSSSPTKNTTTSAAFSARTQTKVNSSADDIKAVNDIYIAIDGHKPQMSPIEYNIIVLTIPNNVEAIEIPESGRELDYWLDYISKQAVITGRHDTAYSYIKHIVQKVHDIRIILDKLTNYILGRSANTADFKAWGNLLPENIIAVKKNMYATVERKDLEHKYGVIVGAAYTEILGRDPGSNYIHWFRALYADSSDEDNYFDINYEGYRELPSELDFWVSRLIAGTVRYSELRQHLHTYYERDGRITPDILSRNYVRYLGREPSNRELQHALDGFNNGTLTRTMLIRYLKSTPERKAAEERVGQSVTKIYREILGRSPSNIVRPWLSLTNNRNIPNGILLDISVGRGPWYTVPIRLLKGLRGKESFKAIKDGGELDFWTNEIIMGNIDEQSLRQHLTTYKDKLMKTYYANITVIYQEEISRDPTSDELDDASIMYYTTVQVNNKTITAADKILTNDIRDSDEYKRIYIKKVIVDTYKEYTDGESPDNTFIAKYMMMYLSGINEASVKTAVRRSDDVLTIIISNAVQTLLSRTVTQNELERYIKDYTSSSALTNKIKATSEYKVLLMLQRIRYPMAITTLTPKHVNETSADEFELLVDYYKLEPRFAEIKAMANVALYNGYVHDATVHKELTPATTSRLNANKISFISSSTAISMYTTPSECSKSALCSIPNMRKYYDKVKALTDESKASKKTSRTGGSRRT